MVLITDYEDILLIMTMKRQFNFTKWWLTGFTQADGSFVVVFEKRNQGVIPYRPRPYFVITQSIRELDIMKALHQYLGVGNLRTNRGSVDIVVRSIEDIFNVIIPHFDEYPLRGGKLISYLIFRRVMFAIKDGLHNTPTGFLQILNTCYFTHSTSNRSIETKQFILESITSKFNININSSFSALFLDFPTCNPLINLEYIAGLVDGDGSLNFSFRNQRRRITANFTITLGIDDFHVLQEIKKFFSCGNVYILDSDAGRFQVESVTNLLQHVKPLLESTSLNTIKASYLPATFEAWSILDTKGIKSDENLLRVVDLVYDMNLDGKRRKLDKFTYLQNFISTKVK